MPDGHCYYDGDPDEYVGVVARAYEWARWVSAEGLLSLTWRCMRSSHRLRPRGRRRLSFIRRRFFRRRRRICSWRSSILDRTAAAAPSQQNRHPLKDLRLGDRKRSISGFIRSVACLSSPGRESPRGREIMSGARPVIYLGQADRSGWSKLKRKTSILFLLTFVKCFTSVN